MAARDVVLIGVLVFALAVISFVVYFIANRATDQMLSMPAINQSASTVEVLKTVETNSNRLDGFIFAVFLGLSLSLILTGYFIGGHPIFMIFYFIVIVAAVFASMILANTWESTTNASIFGSTITHFPLTNHVVLNLPMYIVIVGMLGMIAMFAKPDAGGAGY